MKVKGIIAFLVAASLALCWLVPTAGASPEQVTIVRDSHGEPHIRGDSAAATMYGFGYAQMEDQAAWVLSSIYRSVGRSAEVEGPACEPDLAACFLSDQLTRLFRIPESAYQKFDSLSADDQARFHAFADGINAYIRDRPDSVPDWARPAGPVTGPDVVAGVQWSFLMTQVERAGKLFNFPVGSPSSVGNSGSAMSRSLADPGGSASPKRFIDLFDSPAYRTGAKASNMFAVDGSKTASGKPILNTGPHLDFTGATQWYQAQLSYPGATVQGVTFRGNPAIGIGNNGHVAWGHTALQAIHEQDAYKETLDPADPNRYMYDGASVPMAVRTVNIKARTAPATVATIPVTFRYTIHGPVATDPPAELDGTQPVPGTLAAGSVTASEYEQVGLASEMWRQAEAKTMNQFKQAMSNVQLSNFNTMAADSDGNIFYVAQSRSGVLNDSPQVDFSNGWLDGSDSYNTWISGDPLRPWTGVIPFVDLPQAENPASGYYQNANNTPWTTAPGQIDETDVPYYMRRGGNGTRSRRQVDLLDSADGLTLAEVDAFGMDDYVEFAPALIGLLDLAAADHPGNAKLVAATGVLDAWDFRSGAGSTQYPLFLAWFRALKPNNLGFDPKQAPAPYPEGLNGQPGGPTQAQINEAARAMAGTGQAYDAMIDAFGTIEQNYGAVHTMDWGDFSGPIGGTGNPIQALLMTGCDNVPKRIVILPCSAGNGSGYIMNFDFSDGAMHTSKPASASDDPASPFYTKNAEEFATSSYRAFPITKAEVNAEKTSQTDLVIGDPGAGLTPSTHDFGSRDISAGPGPAQIFTLASDGEVALEVDAVTITGNDPADFSLNSENCSAAILEPAQSCQVSVSFNPGTVGPGQASLSITSDAASSPDLAGLTGQGIAAPVPPEGKARVRMGRFRKVVTRNGRLKLRMRCAVAAMKRCTGRLVIKARRQQFSSRRMKPRRARQMLPIARRGYSIHPGNRTIRIRVVRNARKRLRHHNMKVWMFWSVRQASGTFQRHRNSFRLRLRR